MSNLTNADALAAELAGLADCLDLTRGTGRNLLAHAAVKISDRAQSESGPDGPWAPNAGRNGEKKQALGLPVGKGLKDSAGARMLSLEQLKGRQEITPTEAVLTYGEDDEANRKGQWFSAGSTATPDAEPSGAKGQVARPFFILTDADVDELATMAADEVGRFLRGA